MERTYWLKQTKAKPLFADLLWSRPENKQMAGKLLIIGGNLHGFAAPAEAYQKADEAGVGLTRVLLPLSVKSVAKGLLQTVEFAPSTHSGSFSRAALADFLENSSWADGVLVAGDLGRNSETAVTLEKFLDKYAGQVTLVKDAADYGIGSPDKILHRSSTLLVVTMAQLQKLFANARKTEAITFDMDLLKLIEMLHNFTSSCPLSIFVKQHNHLIVASGGQVSTTETDLKDDDMWRVATAAQAAVWWLQNPDKTLEALTTAVLQYD